MTSKNEIAKDLQQLSKSIQDKLSKAGAPLLCPEELETINNAARALRDGIGTNMQDKDYVELEKACNDHSGAMSQSDAILFICQECGFEASQIKIVDTVSTYRLVDHMYHKDNSFCRQPLYFSTDWNYIRFDVRDWQYEYVNGQLYEYFS